jgi:lysophospholipase L1-like esterase
MTCRSLSWTLLGIAAMLGATVAGCGGGTDNPVNPPDGSIPSVDTGQPVADTNLPVPDTKQSVPDTNRDPLLPDTGRTGPEPGRDASPPDSGRDLTVADSGRDQTMADTGGTSIDTRPTLDTGGSSGGTPPVALQGRFDRTDATRPSFGWSGSSMVARFEGTGATLRMDGSPNQFAVVLDGVLSPVLKIVSGTTQYAVATGLAAGVHDLVVWKRTEGNQGENRFLGLDIVGGQLLAPPVPDRRIEIYGDSITAGYGLDGKDQNCSFSQDTENHYLSYGALAARTLAAELHTIAWSGIGMYRNYGEAGPSKENMPAVYARTLTTKADSVWDFTTWQPHAVVINLGTNDASTSGDPGTPYETNYLNFVKTLRQKYPDTFFVLTIGPMLSGTSLSAIRTHLQNVIKTRAGDGDTKLSFLEFPEQTSGYGCDWHPGAATHAKMAPLLVTELKKQLGW